MKKYISGLFVLILLMSFNAFAEDEVILSDYPVIVYVDEENPEAHIYDIIFDNATDDDILQLQRVVYYEAACAECPLDVEVAVVETVLNRVLSKEWPNTIAGVCTDTRYGRQFVCKYYIPENDRQQDLIDRAIEHVRTNGPTVLPGTDYQFFATKKQSLGKNHIWIGERRSDGSPKKGKGMYFCEPK